MTAFLDRNMDFLRLLEGARTPFWTKIFEGVTMLGEELVPILVLCLLYWCINKKLAYGIGAVFFVTGTIVQGMKISFRIPRPWDLDAAFSAVAGHQDKLYGSYSFPSGHTQTAAALFGTMGFALKNKLLKTLCFLIVALVGFSRMYLGVHTPLDVVFSWILVLVAAGVASRFLCGDAAPALDRAMLVILLVLSAGLFILAWALNAGGAITGAFMTDSFKQAASAVGFALGAFVERRYIRMEVKARTIWGQILKYVCGIAGVLAIKEGLKLVIGTGLIVDSLRYFLLIFWIAALFPMIVKAVSCSGNKKQKAA